MTERKVPLRLLLDVLPDLTEFDALRDALRRAAIADVSQQWSGRASYSTIDHRIVATSRLGNLLIDAETDVRGRLKRLYDAASIAFSAVTAGAADQKAHQLISLGESAEQEEQWRDALAYYLLAHATTRQSSNLDVRALVLRRVGRSSMNVGDFVHATHYYFSSLTAAAIVGDLQAQVIAATGLGNVAAYQGRIEEAVDWFGKALRICGTDFPRERAQLNINLSVAARELRNFDEAQHHLNESYAAYRELPAMDRSSWHNNLGLLLLAQGDLAGAEKAFRAALDGDPGHYNHAMILDNLAEVALARNDLELAEQLCRDAEEEAVSHGSPRALAQVYLQLGKIATRRQDANGVNFFEKAIDMTAGKQYPLLVGEIYREYGRFRKALGDAPAARALLERARDLFIDIGAKTPLEEVQRELDEAADLRVRE